MAEFEFTLKSVEVDGEKIISKQGLDSGGYVQQVIDSECLRLMDPFVPFDTGALRDNGVMHTAIGSGNVVYNSPYARKQYYIPMNHDGQRCAYWFEEMKNSGGKVKILQAAQRAAAKGK